MKKVFLFLLIILASLSFFSCKEEMTEEDAKYIFLFIGDGFGMDIATLEENVLSEFEVFGTATTHNLSSEITDSASAATAIASGKKTLDGYVGVDEKGKRLNTLTDFYKKHGLKVGLVSSQAVNHATPAAFYAHNLSRYNYYEIGLDFISSRVDLYVGAGFISPDGEEGNLYELAGERVISEKDVALDYEIDREGSPSLSDCLSTAIEELYSENGFFIMCEGGRIDSALHEKDIASALHEARAFYDAIERALEFYREHPTETLIVVTADHETGGLSLGHTTTKYEMYPEVLLKQTMSQKKYEDEYISEYVKDESPIEEVLKDAERIFGLDNLTEYEKEEISYAYNLALIGKSAYTSEDWEKFSDNNPLSVTLSGSVSRRAGVSASTFYHTASPVGVWAMGVGEERFSGFYDNTEIYEKLINIYD